MHYTSLGFHADHALHSTATFLTGKQDGIGILNVTHELCGGEARAGGNGQIGGWVAPQRKSTTGAAGG